MGYWWFLHSLAEHDRELFEVVWEMVLRGPCEKFSSLVSDYNSFAPLRKVDRSEYVNYMWSLHDNINVSLNKDSMEMETVIDFFKESKACEKECTAKQKGAQTGRFVGM